MRKNLKKILPYVLITVVVLFGQMFLNFGLVTGNRPILPEQTLTGELTSQVLSKRPALIYFWAEWCGICAAMRESVSAVLTDYPGVTIALKSGSDKAVLEYLSDYKLSWPTLNDEAGVIAERYKVTGVPSIFVIDRGNKIVFASSGYISEWGLRLRLWLAGH